MENPLDGRDFARSPETALSAFIRGRKFIKPQNRADVLSAAFSVEHKAFRRLRNRPSFRSLYYRAHGTFRLQQKKTAPFDFIAQIANGTTLLVGEGNLSFSLSLIKAVRVQARQMIATTLEHSSELAPETEENAEKLRKLGVIVMHGVDATKLSSFFGLEKFDTIVFQFPHAGSRDPVEDRNPNFILVRDFLKSARRHLTENGKVLVSAVDTPHYRGAFQFEEAAEKAGFEPPHSYPFDPDKFRDYHHTMTHREGDALDNHGDFLTFIFKPKA